MKLFALTFIREEQHLTREQLSIISGVSLSAIKSLEKGTIKDFGKVELKTLCSLAKALDTTVYKLLEGNESYRHYLK